MKENRLNIFLNGIFKENPIFVMLLGMCPTLAISKSLANALGMGLAVIFVLFFSNLIISLIRKLVPNEIRIPVYIVIIATLVTVVSMLLEAYLYELNQSLGVFVALITVNCIILGRAEAFASKNTPVSSIMDALGMGLGFTGALAIISIIREFFGVGTITIWGNLQINCIKVFELLHIEPFGVLVTNVGGFLVLGLVIGIIVSISMNRKNKTKEATK